MSAETNSIDLYLQEIQILELLKNRKVLRIKCSKKDGIKKQATQNKTTQVILDYQKCRFYQDPNRAFKNKNTIVEIKHSKGELNGRFLWRENS